MGNITIICYLSIFPFPIEYAAVCRIASSLKLVSISLSLCQMSSYNPKNFFHHLIK